MEVTVSIISTAVLLLFVLDPFGNVPVLLSVLKDVPESRVRRVIAREMWYGLLILLGFLFLGGHFLKLFHLQTESVTIAGGVIFFIIGIKLIFQTETGSNIYGSTGEPFMVPIAIPMIAGPSALATLLVLSQSSDASVLEILASLLLAWVVSSVILMSSPMLYRLLKAKGLEALERLMGMLLLIMSVQMFVDGIRGLAL
jgi:multiple antibiotic resistance protein